MSMVEGIIIFIAILLVSAGLIVLCFFMLKKEIKTRKEEKNEQAENKDEELQENVKKAISKKI
ncbi:MAG: hypothetical protein J6X03_01560 [Bacilli bacterium]|nr:hypothetical protein [Bacilli bacterium]